jgi:glutaredoxin
MVSKKSKPIKKVKAAKQPHVHKKDNQIAWKFLTVILGILVVASVYTNGFSFNKLDTARSSLNSLLAQDIAAEAKSSIQEAMASLDTAKALMKNKEFSDSKAKLDFYVMSKCPYGVQVLDGVKPALDKLGNSVDFSVNFIAQDNGDGTFRSLAGETEVQGNIAILCAAKYSPQKYMDMVVCMNENFRSIPANWEECAKKTGVDVSKVNACYSGQEGKSLLSDSIKKSEAVNAQGSPTIFINDKPYSGGRDPLSFTRALCAELGSHPECNKLPACGTDSDCQAYPDKVGRCINPNADNAKCEYFEAANVNLIVINDKTCPECAGYDALTSQLKTLFKGLDVKEYDFQDEEGQRLYNELSLKYLPVYLFDENVKEGEAYLNVQNFLDPVGKYYSLRIGANHNPVSEKRDKPEVELFVMSHCPYGTQAEMGIIPAIELLGDKIDFSLRFVYYSMRGEVEVIEQLNQYCIQKEERSKLLPYLKCFLKAGDTSACLAEAKIDSAKLSSCVAEADTKYSITANLQDTANWLNGRYPLFNIDAQLNTKYQVSGSPTLVINGGAVNTGRDPQSYLNAICNSFTQKPADCETKLSTAAYGPGFGFTVSSDPVADASCG